MLLLVCINCELALTVCNYATPRKRKRETLEEDEDLEEDQFNEAKKKDSPMPASLEIAEDDTGLFV